MNERVSCLSNAIGTLQKATQRYAMQRHMQRRAECNAVKIQTNENVSQQLLQDGYLRPKIPTTLCCPFGATFKTANRDSASRFPALMLSRTLNIGRVSDNPKAG